jgi:hypothetical protein
VLIYRVRLQPRRPEQFPHREKDVQGCARLLSCLPLGTNKPQQLLGPKSTDRDGREQDRCPIPNVYHTTISDDIFRLFRCEFQSKCFMKPESVNAAVEVISFWTVPSLTIPLYSRAHYILSNILVNTT